MVLFYAVTTEYRSGELLP